MLQSPLDSQDAARQNLRWLFLLRNLMITATALVILITVYGAGIKLNTDPLWSVLAAMAALNCLTWFRLQHDYAVDEPELFLHLCLDVVSITALLYFAGGATNPMAWFLLLPLILTATILPQKYTWYMMGLTCSCYTYLIGYFHPLPEIPVEKVEADRLPSQALAENTTFELHAFGTWVGFVFSAGLVAYFVVEMANTLRERERKLAEVREQTLINEQVVALGTLAAGAAHEMGTPLGTMAIIVQELLEDYDSASHRDLRQRLLIFKDQIDRCKNALSVMSASAGQLRAEAGHLEPVKQYLERLIEAWRKQRPGVALNFEMESDIEEANILAERTLSHALMNILNNAADVSPQAISFKARWNQSRLELLIEDQGPGINPALTQALGKHPVPSKKQGLGVGLFLAYNTIERMGGEISMQPGPGGGTHTRISLPLFTTNSKEQNNE